MAGKWHLGCSPSQSPIHHGFDEFLGVPYSHDMWPGHPETPDSYPPLPLIEGDQAVDPDITPDEQAGLTARFTERAVSFIRRHRDRPFFFYLAFNQPHVPLFAGDRFRGKSERGLYGDVIEEIDGSVGEILRTLEETGLDDRTLVLFTSDNGPWLSYGDHAGSAGPLREGKGTCYEGGIREPMIARWPGHIPPGTVCREPAATIDVLPTLAAMTDAPLPRSPIDGKDIRPLLFGEPGAQPARLPVLLLPQRAAPGPPIGAVEAPVPARRADDGRPETGQGGHAGALSPPRRRAGALRPRGRHRRDPEPRQPTARGRPAARGEGRAGTGRAGGQPHQTGRRRGPTAGPALTAAGRESRRLSKNRAHRGNPVFPNSSFRGIMGEYRSGTRSPLSPLCRPPRCDQSPRCPPERPGWPRLTSFAMVGCGFWASTRACRARITRGGSRLSCAAIAGPSWARSSVRSRNRRPGSCPIRPRARSSGWRRAEDRDQETRLAEDHNPVFATCQELIARRRLQMNLVDVELIHGRERVVFYYLAEKRVDFRELVKDLARVLRTRIEMRQIGVRDEAKLLADYGDCGKPVCCNTHLTRMPPVSMKMAKIQKTTLDPAKISGRCGRLKCCLRYEYDTYRTMEKTLPAGRVEGHDRRRPGPDRRPGDPRPEGRGRVRRSPADHRRPPMTSATSSRRAGGGRPAPHSTAPPPAPCPSIPRIWRMKTSRPMSRIRPSIDRSSARPHLR